MKKSFIKKLDRILQCFKCEIVNHCESPGMADSNAWV